MQKPKFREITIIGPGLIGASLGLILKNKKIAKKIIGIDISQKNINDAINNKSIDEGRLKIDKKIGNSDVIFICTPVSLIDSIANQIYPYLSNHTIVTDVGSVKNCFTTNTIKLYNKKSFLIPGHPIAGTEHSGAKSAKLNLFLNKWCILTPMNKQKKQLSIISNIWKRIGAKISIMSADQHDKIMSITSHLPHLIAFTIVGTAFKIDLKKKKELINFSAGGFRDFTRIGSSDPKMWVDIFIHNRKYLLKTLKNFSSDIKTLENSIKNCKEKEIFNILKKNKEIRKSILKIND
ncbi:MAG: cyclohexadienyl dehydrogenase [Rickettsiales bacterium]|nr:cyclohexadienyl dehydrogenase [Rickettsiales bacterium]